MAATRMVATAYAALSGQTAAAPLKPLLLIKPVYWGCSSLHWGQRTSFRKTKSILTRYLKNFQNENIFPKPFRRASECARMFLSVRKWFSAVIGQIPTCASACALSNSFVFARNVASKLILSSSQQAHLSTLCRIYSCKRIPPNVMISFKSSNDTNAILKISNARLSSLGQFFSF